MQKILLLVVFFSSLALIKAYKKLADTLGLLDIPNDRSSHKKPIPLGAGVTFALCFAPAAFYLRWTGYLSSDSFYLLGLGALFCTILGFIDDLKPLTAKLRLIAQTSVACISMLFLTNMLQIPFEVRFLPFNVPIISFIFGVLFIIWMINLFNFMDGLDGLLGSQAFLYGIASYFLCLFSGNHSLGAVYLLFSALTLPFLIFNWRPAKIFMGDAGAYFFGFSYAFLSLVGKIEYDQSLVAQVVLMSVLIADATFTLFFRIVKTKGCFGAHRNHCFQLIKDNYLWRTSKIVSLYIALTIFVFFPLSLFAIYMSSESVYICFGTYLILGLLYIYFINRPVNKTK